MYTQYFFVENEIKYNFTKPKCSEEKLGHARAVGGAARTRTAHPGADP